MALGWMTIRRDVQADIASNHRGDLPFDKDGRHRVKARVDDVNVIASYRPIPCIRVNVVENGEPPVGRRREASPALVCGDVRVRGERDGTRYVFFEFGGINMRVNTTGRTYRVRRAGTLHGSGGSKEADGPGGRMARTQNICVGPS